nr:hypothetical protein [Burkholderia ubonensis]
MLIDRGYLSPLFADSDSHRVVLEEPRILLCDMNISAIAQLLPVLEAISGTGKPLLVRSDAPFHELARPVLRSIWRPTARHNRASSGMFQRKMIRLPRELATAT